jgi:hypothetical protein
MIICCNLKDKNRNQYDKKRASCEFCRSPKFDPVFSIYLQHTTQRQIMSKGYIRLMEVFNLFCRSHLLSSEECQICKLRQQSAVQAVFVHVLEKVACDKNML